MPESSKIEYMEMPQSSARLIKATAAVRPALNSRTNRTRRVPRPVPSGRGVLLGHVNDGDHLDELARLARELVADAEADLL
jgi:hypothetical protein